jgi:hypothetical protein
VEGGLKAHYCLVGLKAHYCLGGLVTFTFKGRKPILWNGVSIINFLIDT